MKINTKKEKSKLLFLVLALSLFFVMSSSFLLAATVERNFSITSPLCQNQVITVTYTLMSPYTDFWWIDEYISLDWNVIEQTPNGFNQLRVFINNDSNQILFHLITPSIPGNYSFNWGKFWTYNDDNIISFPNQTFDVQACSIPTNCSDKDQDGIFDYNPDNQSVSYCPGGRDRCVQENFNFSEVKPLYSQDITMGYSPDTDFRNISGLTFSKPGYGQILFAKPLKLIDLNSTGCFKPLNITPFISIEKNKITILKENYSEFNKTLYVLFENITFKRPMIKIDGAVCGNECVNLSYNSSSKTYIAGITGNAISQSDGGYYNVGFFQMILGSLINLRSSLTGKAIDSSYSANKKFTMSPTGNVVFEIYDQCADTIQNGDETGIDCGGSCSACSTTPPVNEGGSGGDGTGSNDGDNGPSVGSTGNNTNLNIGGGLAGLESGLGGQNESENQTASIVEFIRENKRVVLNWLIIVIVAAMILVILLIIVYFSKRNVNINNENQDS